MATARFYEATDMNSFEWHYGLPIGHENFAPTWILGIDQNYPGDPAPDIHNHVLYRGTFVLDKAPDGSLLGVGGGTMTSYGWYVNDIVRAKVSGFSVDAVSALIYMELGASSMSMNQEFSQEIYMGDDTIVGSSFNDSLSGFSGDDIINGNRRHDRLQGNDGNDTLDGDTGNDTLIGGTGKDILTGDVGSDSFHYDFTKERGDRIVDFNKAEDFIEISAAGFGAGLVAGELPGSRFQHTARDDALNANVRFIFDTNDHKLYFDADGSGAKAAMLIATFHDGADMTASNFFIV